MAENPKEEGQVMAGIVYETDFNTQTKIVTVKTIVPGIGVIALNQYPFDFIRDSYYACKKKLGQPSILKPFRGIINHD